MATLSENVRKVTTFFLAAFLWLHAVCFLNPQSAFISKCTQLLQLTTSEVVLFALLVIFSFASGSGFWKPLRTVAYIYTFPFVLLIRVFYWCFLILRAMHRWFKAQANLQLGVAPAVKQNESPIVPVLPASSSHKVGVKTRAEEVLQFALRPFRRFTFLWCILLLVTTHTVVVWLCLIVVLFHLARNMLRILNVLLFSDPWFSKLGAVFLRGIDTALAGIAIVTPDTPTTPELTNFWNQLNLWTKLIDFLKDPYLVSRWAWVIVILTFGSIYTYIAALFSFAYYGIARVSGVSYSWPEALVTSVFLPFFVSDLPKVLALRALAGLHGVLVVAVGIGTIVNVIQRRLRSIHIAAMDISERLADHNIREKLVLLEAKVATTPTNVPLKV